MCSKRNSPAGPGVVAYMPPLISHAMNARAPHCMTAEQPLPGVRTVAKVLPYEHPEKEPIP